VSARRTAGRALSAVLLALVASGCPWFTDFKDQPRIEPWEGEYAGNDTTPFRGNPQLSVPITGVEVPGYLVSYQPLPATVDSMSTLKNPRPPTPQSLDNGRKYYQINCAVCHGAAGAGNGPAVRYGVPAPNLLTPITQGRTDGYIFAIIRNGRGLMPTYDRIEDMDRWDVVNYVRALQGKLGTPADTSPAGWPGQNGRFVPGYTRTAPSRPAPYRPADLDARIGTATAAAAPAPAETTRAGTTHAAPGGGAAPKRTRP
jgi:mono/diheme cytochrome c family protein